MWVDTTVTTYPLVVSRTTTDLGEVERVLMLLVAASCRGESRVDR